MFLEITCPLFDLPQNGSASTDSVLVETVVIFQCNAGYELSADSALKCNSSGEWNQTSPDCLGKQEREFESCNSACFLLYAGHGQIQDSHLPTTSYNVHFHC